MEVRPIDGNVLLERFRPYLHTGEAIPADVVIEDILWRKNGLVRWENVKCS